MVNYWPAIRASSAGVLGFSLIGNQFEMPTKFELVVLASSLADGRCAGSDDDLESASGFGSNAESNAAIVVRLDFFCCY